MDARRDLSILSRRETRMKTSGPNYRPNRYTYIYTSVFNVSRTVSKTRQLSVAEFSKIVNNRRSLLGTDNSIAGSLMSVFTEAGVKKYLHKTAQLIGA